MSHRKFTLAGCSGSRFSRNISGLAGIPAASATTTSVSTAVDSFLNQRAPDRTYGDGRHIRTCPATCEGVGSSERSVLVQFSVSAIPAGASGVTAKIELTPWGNSSGNSDRSRNHELMVRRECDVGHPAQLWTGYCFEDALLDVRSNDVGRLKPHSEKRNLRNHAQAEHWESDRFPFF